jgi:hypothetical protein
MLIIMGKMNVEIQIIGKRVVVARTRKIPKKQSSIL